MKSFVIDHVRTRVGKYGGALAEARPDDLAAEVLKALSKRNNLNSPEVDEVILGSANQAGEDNRNVARMATLLANFATDVPAYTVNRLCASGLQAVANAHEGILSNRLHLAIAGGAESMTRAPWVTEKPNKPWAKPGKTFDSALGWRFINPKMDSHDNGNTTLSLGLATEKLAKEHGITRVESDEFACRSHELAAESWRSGFFANHTIQIETKNELLIDETIRETTSLESLGKLKASFSDDGIITAGNSSPLSDGASGTLVASEDAIKEFSLKPKVEILGFVAVGVKPYQFGYGPVPAIEKLLNKHNLKINDIDAIEINEAFASQVLVCQKALKIKTEVLNSRGGGIALGHPLGSSGSRILGTLIERLINDDLELGIASLCIGVGQGAAMLVKRI